MEIGCLADNLVELCTHKGYRSIHKCPGVSTSLNTLERKGEENCRGKEEASSAARATCGIGPGWTG